MAIQINSASLQQQQLMHPHQPHQQIPPSRENSQSSYKHLKPGGGAGNSGSSHDIINQSSASHMSGGANPNVPMPGPVTSAGSGAAG